MFVFLCSWVLKKIVCGVEKLFCFFGYLELNGSVIVFFEVVFVFIVIFYINVLFVWLGWDFFVVCEDVFWVLIMFVDVGVFFLEKEC